MAIPSNYIDKITKEGDSRPICPAADKVRVDNENFEADNLDDVLDEVAEAIEDAGGGYNPPAGGIPKTDLAPGVQTSLGLADTAVQDNDYTHTDNNYTDAEKTKLAGLPTNPVTSISVNGQSPQTPTNGNVNLVVQAGAQGQKGDKGDTVVLDPQGLPQFTIVNDLVSGGEADALSAEMGRRLAMLSGTYAEAWAHAQAIPFAFMWMWSEVVDGEQINKPIWHIGSNNFVDAAGSPISVVVTASAGDPTISGTEGSTVPKDTVITITPASGCALHYSVDGGSTYKVADRAVNITLSTAGAKTIMAYCSNPNGSTTPVTRHITVAGTAVPTLPTSGEIARGGSVTVSVSTGGELHYRINGGSWVTSANLSESITIANHLNQQEQMVIEAYNIVGGDQSDTVTGTYTMAALQAPTLTPAGGEVASGSTVAITAPSGNIYYTTDGSDPTDQSTAYSSAIAITGSGTTTIKAIAKDTYGYSAISSGTYSVAVPKLKVKTNAATTMTLTKTDDTTIDLALVDNSGTDNYNEFDINTDLGGVTTFKSCAFGAKTSIVEVDFAGITLNDANGLFNGASSLIRVVGLVVNGPIDSAFRASKVEYIQVSGDISSGENAFYYASYYGNGLTLDVSDLKISTTASGFKKIVNLFGAAKILGTLDIRNLNINASQWLNKLFNGCSATKLVIGGNFYVTANSGYREDMFKDSSITSVRIVSSTPPPLTNYDWVADLLAVQPNATIEVPSGYGETYKTDSTYGWSTYASLITEYND